MAAHSPGKTWAIVNPAAGNGRAGQQWPVLAARLRAADIAFTPCVTCGPGDAALCAREAIADGAATIVVVGGDGTLNEVVNGCLADGHEGDARARPTLAPLPVGTGADFARGLGISRRTAIETLLCGRARAVDAGHVAFRDDEGAERGRYFINIADLGLGRAANLAVERGPNLPGPAAYLYGALASIARYSPAEARLVVDGREVYRGSAAMIGVANGLLFGGGMRAAPKARHNDGLFDVLLLEGVARRALLTDLLPRVYRGAHLRHPAVHFFRGQTVVVGATTPFPLQVDGEGIGMAPARFTLLPGALRVLTPGLSPGSSRVWPLLTREWTALR